MCVCVHLCVYVYRIKRCNERETETEKEREREREEGSQLSTYRVIDVIQYRWVAYKMDDFYCIDYT